MNNDFLICIFNYRHDDNARRWLKLLSPHFETVVLDSGNDKVCSDFIQFPNIYYSGLFNEMKKLSEKKDYKWIGCIPSDVEINNENALKIIEKIEWLITTKNIGIWQPSLDQTSRNWLNNIHNSHINYEGKKFIEANIFFIKNEILKKALYIDTNENTFGYGISEMISLLSLKMEYNNIFDNTIQVHHPKKIGYSNEKAIKESRIWTPKMAEHFGFDYDSIIHPKSNSLGEIAIQYNGQINHNDNHNLLINNNFLICIFNYRHDDNARRWLNLLSPHFETVVLDSGNDKICSDFIQFPNIYYSGLFNEMKKLSEKKDYKWVGIITSDIEIDDINVKKLIYRIKWLNATENIGTLQPSLDSSSRIWNNNVNNNKYKFESKKFLEGHTLFIKNSLFKQYPYVDTKVNKYGWGVCEYICSLSLKNNLLNIFDNTIIIHHPNKSEYDNNEANKQCLIWKKTMKNQLNLEILDTLPTENSLGEANIIYNNMITNELLAKICQPSEGELIPYYSEKERIIVTMTSWPKRISNVPVVLDTILKNTILPDLIVVNLSTEEFPNKENDLPESLNNLIKEQNGLIEINWLKYNTTVWKKIFPTLYKYPNDSTINIDDDFLYPSDFIETFKNKRKETNNTLSGVSIKLWKNMIQHCGCASLDRLEWFGNYPNNITQECLDKIGDDDFYTYCIYANNKQIEFVGKKFFANMKAFNAVESFTITHHQTSRTPIHKILDSLLTINEKKNENIEVKNLKVEEQPQIKGNIKTDNDQLSAFLGQKVQTIKKTTPLRENNGIVKVYKINNNLRTHL